MGQKKDILYLQQLSIRETEELCRDEALLADAFGSFRESAGNPVLVELFERLQKESQGTLERMRSLLEDTPRKVRPALKGVLEEGEHRVSRLGNHHLVDAELIATAQRLLGYQVAGLENVRVFSKLLRQEKAVQTFAETIETKREAMDLLSRVALHQVHWRASWWAPEHTSRWDRVKSAFHRDWQQTKARVGAGEPPEEEQSVGDTLSQIAGRRQDENVTVEVDHFEAEEPAFRYGYGAAQYYGDRPWDDALEEELRSNYGGLWDPARDSIRAGWDYAMRERGEEHPELVTRPEKAEPIKLS